jgi:type II secretory pathway pseudopilin PulG
MIVVAIIGVLAAIAVPKFADLINKSKEGATKGALGSIRSAIDVYYGDNEGWFPTDDLSVLTVNSKYIGSIPETKLPGTDHADSNAVMTVGSILPNGLFDTSSSAGGTGPETGIGGGRGGGWAYFNNPAVPTFWGTFMVNCIHGDLAGQNTWTSF